MYSDCKENIINEDICDTAFASPSCSYKYLRHYTDTCGAVVLLEHFQAVPTSESSYVERDK